MLRKGLALALLLVACRQESAETTTTDSTSVRGSTDQTGPSRIDSVSVPSDPLETDAPRVEKGVQLLPVDNASKDISFVRFREQLLNAVKAKDAAALLRMIDSNIHLSFGGQSGLKDLREMWKPENRQSKLWSELEWILTHGGDFRKEAPNTFWAPYVYSNWPEQGPDPFEYAAITEADVTVYEKPDEGSDQISRLSYHLVLRLEGTHLREDRLPFVKITTPEGKTGYVKSDLVRSSIDYRAGFNNRDGRWRLSSFIAGD